MRTCIEVVGGGDEQPKPHKDSEEEIKVEIDEENNEEIKVAIELKLEVVEHWPHEDLTDQLLEPGTLS